VTLPDPTDVIAPRGDDLPYETSDFLQEMMEGAYPDGVVLDYHGLKLYSRCQYENGVRVYDVYTEDENYVETVNLTPSGRSPRSNSSLTRSWPTTRPTATSG
jgi:hypothetical protein